MAASCAVRRARLSLVTRRRSGTARSRSVPRDDARHQAARYRRPHPGHDKGLAGGQLQLDTYGELLQTACLYAEPGERVEADIGPGWRRSPTWLARLWHEPDAGIWEARGKLAHFAHSNLMCWVRARPGGPASPGSA